MAKVQSGLTSLPTGLTLIQRPGQQPQLVQVQTAPVQQQQQPTQIQHTIVTQPAMQQQTQLRPQQIVLQQKPPQQQRLITTTGGMPTSSTQQVQLQRTHIIQMPQQQLQQQPQHTQAAPQRKGLSLSVSSVSEIRISSIHFCEEVDFL